MTNFTGNEKATLNSSGFFQTTLTAIASWVISTYSGFTQSGTGATTRTLQGKLQDVASVKDFGAKGNTVQLSDGSITAASAVLSSASAVFSVADIGKAIVVNGAGASAGPLQTTIVAFTSSTQVTLASSAIMTVAHAALAYGTDDTAAIKAGCAALTAAGGGELWFPQGMYWYDSTVFTDVLTGVTLRGVNRYGSQIATPNPNATMFYIAGNGGKITTLGLVSLVPGVANEFLRVAGTENVVEDLYFSGDHLGINLIGAITKIHNIRFGAGASGGVRILVNCGDASPVLSHIEMGAQAAPYPGAGIRLTNVTALKMSNIDVLQQGNGLEIVPGDGQAVNDVNIVNCFFDTCTNGAWIQPTGTGSVSRIEMVNSWTGDATQNGILINNAGTGIVAGIDLINHQSPVCGQSGISTNGACSQITLIGGLYSQNGIHGGYFGHTGDLTVIGVKAGAYAGMSANAQYGLVFDSELTSLVCSGNGVMGNVSGGIHDLTSQAIPKFISGNVEPGFAKYGAITVGASPFLYTAAFDQTVYLAGGTVTGVTVGGVTPFGTSNVSVNLKRGDSVQVTYSAIPYMNFTA